MITRRSLLGYLFAGTAGLVMTACGRKQLTETPVDIMGETRESGDPLWLSESEAWLVASSAPGQATILAVSGLCPYDDRRVGWCTATNTFQCPLCASLFDEQGRKIRQVGPAESGLDLLRVTVSGDGSVVVDRGTVTPAGIVEGAPADHSPNQCVLTIPKTTRPSVAG